MKNKLVTKYKPMQVSTATNNQKSHGNFNMVHYGVDCHTHQSPDQNKIHLPVLRN